MSEKKGKKQETVKQPVKAGAIMTVKKSVLRHICSFSNIVDEMKITVSRKDGILIKAVDPAHVLMRELHIKPSHLLIIDRDMEIGVDLDRLRSVLPVIAEGDEIAIGCTEGLSMLTLAYGHHYLEVTPADLMGLSDPKMPTLKHPGCYRVNVDDLQESVKLVEGLSSHIRFEGDPGGFSVLGEGAHRKYKGNFPGTCIDFDNTIDGDFARVIWNVHYVDGILRTYKSMKVTEVWLQLRTDYPGIFEIEDQGFHDRHLLAPRIENE